MLRESHDSGQKLAFRVMCCSTTRGEPYHPAWLKDLGGRELQSDQGWGKVYPIPEMDDGIVLGRHLDFVKRLGQHYDGHPDIDHVDLGSVGWWGEWHLSDSKNCKLPTLENRKKIVEAYLAAFQKTPLLMLVNGEECLTYATQHGTGWRADSLGDLGFLRSWSHMKKGYPTWIREAGVQEAWKTAPVAWETGGDMRHWVAVGWSLRYILNYALALHGSYINNKSAPLPSGRGCAARNRAVSATAWIPAGVEGTEASRQVRPGDKMTGDEMAECWLRSVLQAVPSCLQAFERPEGYEKVFVGDGDREQVAPWVHRAIHGGVFQRARRLAARRGRRCCRFHPATTRSVARNLHLFHCRCWHRRHQADCAIGNQGPIRGWVVSVEHREYWPLKELSDESRRRSRFS